MTCKVSASQSGPCPRFSYFCHHISQIWCHDAISPFGHCHSVILFTCLSDRVLHVCTWAVLFLHLVAVLSICTYNVTVFPLTRCTGPTSYHLPPWSHCVSHPVCCTPPTPSIITVSVCWFDCDQNSYSHTDFASVKMDVCRKYRKNNWEISVPFLFYKNALKTAYY